MSKMSAIDRIRRAHISLMRNKDWVWLAPVCLVGKVTIEEDFPTAATNGRDVIYGRKFIETLSDEEVLAVVVHENLHKAYMHFNISKSLRDRFGDMLLNLAMDFVINRSIKKGSPYLKMGNGWCYDPKYDDDMRWDTIRIAEDLQQGGGKKEKSKENGADQMDKHDWDSADSLSAEDAANAAKAIEQAMRQGQQLSKQMAGNVPRDIGELLTPVVDWREALRDFVTERTKGGDIATYAKPNRRYLGMNIYMPSTYSEKVQRVLFLCDTSGSIGPEALREVLTEVHGCLESVKPEEVDIIYWDTAVAKHEHYVGEDAQLIINSTKPAGGGGTAPSCAVAYCQEKNIKPTVAIWLSDGYVGGDWGEGLECPAIWVISSGGCAPNHLPHVMLPQR